METTIDRPTLAKLPSRKMPGLVAYGTVGSPVEKAVSTGSTYQPTMPDVLDIRQFWDCDLCDAHGIVWLGRASGTVDRVVWVTENEDFPQTGTDLGTFAQEYVLEAEITVVESLRPLIVPDDFHD